MKVLISRTIPMVDERLTAWNCQGNEETTEVITKTKICTRLRDYNLVCYSATDNNGEDYYIVVIRNRILITYDNVIRGEDVTGTLVDIRRNSIAYNVSVHLDRPKVIASNYKNADIVYSNSPEKYMVLEIY